MLDLRPVRDLVNAALSGLPVAATWFYTSGFGDARALHIAILPLEAIPARRLSEIGDALHDAVGTNAFITNLLQISASRAEDILWRAVLIEERHPLSWNEFARSLTARREEAMRKAAELELALEQLRDRAMRAPM